MTKLPQPISNAKIISPAWQTLFKGPFWVCLVLYLFFGVGIIARQVAFKAGLDALGPWEWSFVFGVILGLMYCGHQGLMISRYLKKMPNRWLMGVASVLRFVVTAGLLVWAAQGKLNTAGVMLLGFLGPHLSVLSSQLYLSSVKSAS